MQQEGAKCPRPPTAPASPFPAPGPAALWPQRHRACVNGRRAAAAHKHAPGQAAAAACGRRKGRAKTASTLCRGGAHCSSARSSRLCSDFTSGDVISPFLLEAAPMLSSWLHALSPGPSPAQRSTRARQPARAACGCARTQTASTRRGTCVKETLLLDRRERRHGRLWGTLCLHPTKSQAARLVVDNGDRVRYHLMNARTRRSCQKNLFFKEKPLFGALEGKNALGQYCTVQNRKRCAGVENRIPETPRNTVAETPRNTTRCPIWIGSMFALIRQWQVSARSPPPATRSRACLSPRLFRAVRSTLTADGLFACSLSRRNAPRSTTTTRPSSLAWA